MTEYPSADGAIAKGVPVNNVPLSQTQPWHTPLSLPPKPVNVTVLTNDQLLILTVGRDGGLFFDMDDTIQKSNEALYEGRFGSYSLALRELLGERYDFCDWEKHNLKECLGKGLNNDCVCLSRALSDIYGEEITPQQLFEAVSRIQRERLDELYKAVTLSPGVLDFINSAFMEGIPLAVCSAAPNVMVQYGVKHHGLEQFFRVVLGDAEKKTSDSDYTGKGLQEAAKLLGAAPSNSCIVGDSCSDLGAGLRGGVGVVVLRPPRGMDLKKLAKLIDLASRMHSTGENGCSVFIISDFSQVVVKSNPNSPCSSAIVISRDVLSDESFGEALSLN
ncbi:MAG: hypothetical protein D6808_02985 [Candidatus Dadabacteria bacterium]|nr:MAG: hypothetical protein D6808_02985 [Candidatus Dadabacteria bacterium]